MKSNLLRIWFSITKIQIWCMPHTVVVCFLLLMREIPVFVSVCGEEKAETPGQLGEAVLSVVCCDCHVCLLILYKIFLLPLRVEFYMCVVVLHAGEGIFVHISHVHMKVYAPYISIGPQGVPNRVHVYVISCVFVSQWILLMNMICCWW